MKKVIIISVTVIFIAMTVFLFFLQISIKKTHFYGYLEHAQLADTSRMFNTHPVTYTKATSCDDYREFLLDIAAYDITYHYFNDLRPQEEVEDEGEEDEEEAEPEENDQSSSQYLGEFTHTNSQEINAEEIDTIKTDRNYMYVLEAGKVHILNALPAQEMTEVAMIDVFEKVETAYLMHTLRNLEQSSKQKMDAFWLFYNKNAFKWWEFFKTIDDSEPEKVYPLGMLLKDNQLIVFFSAEHDFSAVMAYDVSDPDMPKLSKEYYIEGKLSDVRLINDKIYAVIHNDSVMDQILSNNDISLLYNAEIYAEIFGKYDFQNLSELEKRVLNMDEAERKKMIDEYAPIVRQILEMEFRFRDSRFEFPRIFENIFNTNAIINRLNSHSHSSPLITCENLFIPNSIHVKSFKSELTSIVEFSLRKEVHRDWTHVDFVLSNSYTFVGAANLYATNNNLYLVSPILASSLGCGDDCVNYSDIHRIILSDDIQYMGSGEIKGVIKSPYRMSEYNGYLRVFSEPNSPRQNEGSTLSVIDINSMRVTGQIDNIAKGEEIYASRMIGNKGYLVTFRQTDPVFTFDLSNPEKPELKGELKINGYSSYIYPMEENALLTIGRDTTERGIEQGIHLQIFDVSDLANPRRVHQELISEDRYSFSSAMNNSHAFTYHAPSGLLAIPLESSFLIYNATLSNGIKRIGSVIHDYDFFYKSSHSYYNYETYPSSSRFWFKTPGVYDKDVTLYTVSSHGIIASDALNPEKTLSFVRFPLCSDYYYEYLYKRNDYYLRFRGFDERDYFREEPKE